MNNNCLEGIKCPKCGSEGPFIVEVRVQVLMHDEGSEDCNSDNHWDGNSYMRCYMCDADGLAKDFNTTTTQEQDHESESQVCLRGRHLVR